LANPACNIELLNAVSTTAIEPIAFLKTLRQKRIER
jgi:hypothetical protein